VRELIDERILLQHNPTLAWSQYSLHKHGDGFDNAADCDSIRGDRNLQTHRPDRPRCRSDHSGERLGR
jgi:hypothetical protein